jgi:hypothetical protein
MAAFGIVDNTVASELGDRLVTGNSLGWCRRLPITHAKNRTPETHTHVGIGGLGLCLAAGLEEFSLVVYDRPVPGSPTVAWVPRLPKVSHDPRRPMDSEAPVLPKFTRTPGKMLTRRLNRNPIL